MTQYLFSSHNPVKQFFFIRHGESEANKAGTIAGQLDSPLTPKGLQQAERAAELLLQQTYSAIYSSPLLRAYDTARPVANRLGLPIQKMPAFMERNFGALQGHGHIDLEQSPQLPDDAETLYAMLERVQQGLKSCSPLDNAIIVGHSGTWRGIAHALGIAAEKAPVPNATPIRVWREGSDWCVAVYEGNSTIG